MHQQKWIHNLNKWFRTAVTKSFKISSFLKGHMKSNFSCHFLELLVHHFQIRTQLSQDYWMKQNVIPKSSDSELLNKRKCSSQLVFLNFRVQADRWTCKHFILFHLQYTKHIYIHRKIKYAQLISQLYTSERLILFFIPTL